MTLAFTVEELAVLLKSKAAADVSVRGIVEERLARNPVSKALVSEPSSRLEIRVDGNPRYLRHNCLIVDERLVLLGSMNYSTAGSTWNDENLVTVPDQALAAKFMEEFERLWAIAKTPVPNSEEPKPADPD
jgi:phosphatidylserine/phosphatidylglycerophosphate/cardiolipin synthase-like enzyme